MIRASQIALARHFEIAYKTELNSTKQCRHGVPDVQNKYEKSNVKVAKSALGARLGYTHNVRSHASVHLWICKKEKERYMRECAYTCTRYRTPSRQLESQLADLDCRPAVTLRLGDHWLKPSTRTFHCYSLRIIS